MYNRCIANSNTLPFHTWARKINTGCTKSLFLKRANPSTKSLLHRKGHSDTWRYKIRTFTVKNVPVMGALLRLCAHSPSFQGISHADWTWKNADVPAEEKQNSSFSLFHCASPGMPGTEVRGLFLHTYMAIFGIWVRLPFCGLTMVFLIYLFFFKLWAKWIWKSQ